MVETSRPKKSGDRQSVCLTGMKPIGLVFKQEGWDKYRHQPKQGELMLIHRCVKCDKISINRIAGDDDSIAILEVFEISLRLPNEIKSLLEHEGIKLLTDKARPGIKKQLFGKKCSSASGVESY